MMTFIMEHPATLLPNRSPHLRDVMDLDFRRLGKLLTGWRPRYDDDFQVVSHWSQIGAWFADCKPTRLALDLETDERGHIDMVGMAAGPTTARLCALPDSEALDEVWKAIARYGCEVVVHYGEGLEVPWLQDCFPSGIPFTVHDLHKLFHAWDCEYASAGRDKEDQKTGGGSGALAFIQSLYTWRPYHKHLLKKATGFADKAHYCMLDCVVAWEGFHRVEEMCKQEQPAAYQAYLRDAVPLLPIMAESSRNGWLVDGPVFRERRAVLVSQSRAQAGALIASYGDGIRPKGKKAKTQVSVAGLKAVLKARGIKLPVVRRDGGRTSETLNREARQKLVVRYPELSDLDAYWSTQDTLSDCYKNIIGKDGRCHANWSGYLTSWRWRCTKPNIAQWPEQERHVFQASPGMVLVQFDTSAGEYRWFAGESQDTSLLDMFAAYDRSHHAAEHPHVQNTILLFGVSPDTACGWKASSVPIEKAKYTFSKNYIFRLMYSYEGGIDELRATAAKAGLKFSRKDIAALDKIWFAKYPVAAAWRERQARMVWRTRLVECREWGYVRRIHGQDEAKVKNVALNFPMQAGIAGLVNRTVREVYDAWGLVPLANMHDGLVYEVAETDVVQRVPEIKAIMERPLVTLGGLVIPVDVKTGTHWGKGLRV